MTIEEAIKEIKDASDSEVRYGDKDNHYDKVMKRVEAFDMAIKVLEQQPCDDCISREQAIRATYGFERYTGIDEAPYEYAESILRDLPSITPTRPKGKWSRPSVVAMPYSFAYECPICRQWGNIQTFKPNYCPNCGAEMEIENEKETY